MAIKKSQLYASLWQNCDELRGGMDASQYKDYILTLLFMKYVSDKAANGDGGIDVPKGGSFNDMVALRGDKEIGDKINKIIGRLADANEPLKGVIDQADFNDETKLGTGKEMQDRLTNLIGIFNNLDYLSGNRAEGDDLNNLAQVQIELPPITEQNAIATVRSDMDAEITALEQRRDKTITIKQGMMQQLLTGKVRLSESRIIADNTDDAD